jgi:myo-inositol 2-dehydrogenase/D-chiro-inositol 1-dehydrogenase
VAAAVHRRRPVLCEKPLASDAAEAAELAAVVESTGVRVMVGFQRRFDPVMTVARRLVTSGSLGVLQLIRLDSTEPTMDRSDKTNLLRNTAIHDFDLMRWLSGCQAISVHAEGSDRDRGIFDRSRDPDSVVVTIRLTDGSLCSITTSRLSPHGYDVRAELLGSLDHIAAGWTDKTPVRSLEAGPETALPKVWQSWQERFEEAFLLELRAFIAVDQAEAQAVAATVRDGVEAQRIAEAARRSLTEGRTVFL